MSCKYQYKSGKKSGEFCGKKLDSLKEKRLVVQSDSSRVPKYEEIFSSGQNLIAKETSPTYGFNLSPNSK